MNENNEQEIINGFKMMDTEEKAEIEIDTKEKKDHYLRELINYVVLIAIAFGLAQVIHRFIFTPVTVVGPSMMTTIHDDDKIFLSRLGEIHRFDVVVFDVEMSDDPYIKRVIGLPGDYISMENYKLYINGKLVEEPYLNDKSFYTGIEYANEDKVSFQLEDICAYTNINCNIDGKVQIPEGYYLVLGDNRNNSTDSRYKDVGLVSEEKVIGKAIFVFYPFNRFLKTFE